MLRTKHVHLRGDEEAALVALVIRASPLSE
jgi:hypothetical protein